jgi:precorrin-6Y C5,15-methyltransferase (decarboxylating)
VSEVSAHRAKVKVVGVLGDRLDLLSADALEALHSAEVVIAGTRLAGLFKESLANSPSRGRGPQLEEVGADPSELIHRVRQLSLADHQSVSVLVSGDPGFFGVVGALTQVIDRKALEIHPVASSVSLAFSRLSLSWDDAVVVSAQNTTLDELIGIVRTAPKVAVLTSHELPPQAIGHALVEAEVKMDLVGLCSALGTRDEEVRELTLGELAGTSSDPFSVLVLVGPGGLPLVGWKPAGSSSGTEDPRSFGLSGTHPPRPADEPNPEIRSVVLDTLDLPGVGVFWELDADSFEVASRCAVQHPGLTVLVVRHGEAGAQVSTATSRARPSLHLIEGTEPTLFDNLPAPDRVLVGDNSTTDLESLLRRLRPDGRVVALFSSMGAAERAATILGNVIQLSVARGVNEQGGWQLRSEDPLFIAWGPRSDEASE